MSCKIKEYAITTVWLHEQQQNEKFTYRRIDAPKPLPPYIVDVTAEYEGELPGQRGLPNANKLHEREQERMPFEPVLEELPESHKESI